jgi:hypothetical protein
MRPGTRPDAEAIGDLPGRASRFTHVIKHLYARDERWSLAAPELPAQPIQAAREAGCRAIELSVTWSSYHSVCSACQEHVLHDHDRFMRPAYRRALATAIAADRWGTLNDPVRVAEAFVGDNGVFVITRQRARTGERNVATAYRVVPRGVRPDEASAEDFVKAAIRRLYDKTSLGEEGR